MTTLETCERVPRVGDRVSFYINPNFLICGRVTSKSSKAGGFGWVNVWFHAPGKQPDTGILYYSEIQPIEPTR